MSLPSNVTTLSTADVGETVEIRALLYGAGEVAAALRSGDLVTCQAVTAEWLVVARPGCDEVPVSRRDAARVQIERTGPLR